MFGVQHACSGRPQGPCICRAAGAGASLLCEHNAEVTRRSVPHGLHTAVQAAPTVIVIRKAATWFQNIHHAFTASSRSVYCQPHHRWQFKTVIKNPKGTVTP